MKNKEYIKQVRSELGDTQKEIGSRLGVTRKTISAWETGESNIPLIALLVYERFADQEHTNIEKPEQLKDCSKIET